MSDSVVLEENFELGSEPTPPQFITNPTISANYKNLQISMHLLTGTSDITQVTYILDDKLVGNIDFSEAFKKVSGTDFYICNLDISNYNFEPLSLHSLILDIYNNDSHVDENGIQMPTRATIKDFKIQQSYADPIKNLKLTYDSSLPASEQFLISFDTPTNWGYWSTVPEVTNKRGYLVTWHIRGKESGATSFSSSSNNQKLEFNIPIPEDVKNLDVDNLSVQVCVQTWIEDIYKDRIISDTKVFSNQAYLRSELKVFRPVKLYFKTKNETFNHISLVNNLGR
jgi:hypothetical protein